MENRFTPTTWIGSWPVNRNGIEIVDVFSWGLEFRLYNPIVQVWSAGVVHQSKAPKNPKKKKIERKERWIKEGGQTKQVSLTRVSKTFDWASSRLKDQSAGDYQSVANIQQSRRQEKPSQPGSQSNSVPIGEKLSTTSKSGRAARWLWKESMLLSAAILWLFRSSNETVKEMAHTQTTRL